MGPHISIKGEKVFEIFGFPVTNSILTTILIVIGFYFLADYYFKESKKDDKSLFYYGVNGALRYLYDLFHSVLHNKTNTFFSLLMAFFFFILLGNWSGLIPGVGSITIKEPKHAESVIEAPHESELNELGYADDTMAKEEQSEEHSVPLLRGGTADLNTTIALALVSVLITQIFGFQYLGAQVHLGKYFNFKDPIMLFVGILELILEFARIISFSFRLFGNIFAGEVLLTVIPFLLPVAFSFVSSPMYLMEIFVGVVQALVFTMLSAVFINMAIATDH